MLRSTSTFTDNAHQERPFAQDKGNDSFFDQPDVCASIEAFTKPMPTKIVSESEQVTTSPEITSIGLQRQVRYVSVDELNSKKVEPAETGCNSHFPLVYPAVPNPLLKVEDMYPIDWANEMMLFPANISSNDPVPINTDNQHNIRPVSKKSASRPVRNESTSIPQRSAVSPEPQITDASKHFMSSATALAKLDEFINIAENRKRELPSEVGNQQQVENGDIGAKRRNTQAQIFKRQESNPREKQKISRRERNRICAKRSRARKKVELEGLQESLTLLRKENEKLKACIREHLGDAEANNLFSANGIVERNPSERNATDPERPT
eukprot:CAMPEP_0195509702 /NCGR_PEP_ID=MMETSP0794_2-20130614/2561_1 /TAXON_ID=515487 /ORGANISM="Stephanopyxis turris, Strain CCMP 815" /LENGTH=322 /DNA_ID=CAMNT_0040636983 /DNA_START=69 /DNA_END=1037 /DNA_ORIENTATION=+